MKNEEESPMLDHEPVSPVSNVSSETPNDQKINGVFPIFVLVLKSLSSIYIFTIPSYAADFNCPALFICVYASAFFLNSTGSILFLKTADLMDWKDKSTQKLATKLLGTPGLYLNYVNTMVVCLTSIIGLIVSVSIILEDFFCNVLTWNGICFNYKAYAFFAFLPLLIQSVLIQRARHYEMVGWVTALILIALLVSLDVGSISLLVANGPQLGLANKSFKAIVCAFVGFMGTIESNIMVVTLRNEARNKSQVLPGVLLALGVTGFFGLSTGLLVSLAFGDETEDLGFLSWSPSSFISIAGYVYCIANIFYVPIFLFPLFYDGEQADKILKKVKRREKGIS